MGKWIERIRGGVRCITILAAVWLVIEAIYFHVVGEYILYYRLWLRSAEHALDEIAILHEVYNVRQDVWAIAFSVYVAPIIWWISLINSACDLISASMLPDKKHITMCIVGSIATMIIFYVMFLCYL